MPETICVDEELGIIKVDSFGDVTAKQMFETLVELLQLCGTRNISKVLIDASGETSLPSTLDLLDFGARLSPGKVPEDLRFAVVLSPETGKDLHFLETVVQNRGGEARMFQSMGEARSWLGIGQQTSA